MLPLEHSAILSTFIKLPFVNKIFVLSIFEWPLKTGFTVHKNDLFPALISVLRDKDVNLTLKAPIATKVVSFSRLLKC